MARKRVPQVSSPRRMLDEVQFVARPAHEDLIAALRTALDTRKRTAHVVFTGSSRVRLQDMFDSIQAPLFQFSQTTTFPDLGEGFTSCGSPNCYPPLRWHVLNDVLNVVSRLGWIVGLGRIPICEEGSRPLGQEETRVDPANAPDFAHFELQSLTTLIGNSGELYAARRYR